MRIALFLLLLANALTADVFRPLQSVALPARARAMAYDVEANRLLVAGGPAGDGYLLSLAAVDGSYRSQAKPMAEVVSSMANTASGSLLVERASGALLAMDGATDATSSLVSLGHYPGPVAVSANGVHAFALSGCDWRPGLFDTGSALQIIRLGPPLPGRPQVCPIPEAEYGEARSLCVSRDGKTVYVAASPTDYGAATLLAVDVESARIVAHHTTHFPCAWVSPDSLALSTKGEPILAIDGRQGGRLVRYSRELVPEQTLDLPLGPTCLAVTADGKDAAIASRGASSIRLLDLDAFSFSPTFPSPVQCPRLVCFDATGDRLFVGSSYVPELDVMTRTATTTEPPASSPTPVPTEERIICARDEGDERVLFALRPDGTDRRDILRLPKQDTRMMQVSPDGTRILYGKATEKVPDLFSFDLVTGQHRQLTHVVRDQGVSCLNVTFAQFLPHMQAIVYEARFTIHETKLLIVGAEGGPSYPFLDNHDDRDMYPMPHPWDPDRVLFLYDAGNWTFHREIRLFDRNTDAQWIAQPRDGRTHAAPIWAPDGCHLFWSRSGTESQKPANIWTMRIDGTESRPALRPPPPDVARICICVSPDGGRLLCNRQRARPRDVYLADLKSGTTTPLLTTAVDEFAVGWGRIFLPPRQK